MAESFYVEQGTEEWHALRLGRATASRFKDVMAVIKSGESAQRRNYRSELIVERLTGARNDTFTSSAMQWGVDNEPLARLKYSLKTGNSAEECGFFAHDELMAGASPDGLIGDDGLLEIKCPNTATHIETLTSRRVPYLYYWQVMGQLWITGRQWCDFVSFDPRLPQNAAFFTTRVERDDVKIAELTGQITLFLKEVDKEEEFVRNYKEQRSGENN